MKTLKNFNNFFTSSNIVVDYARLAKDFGTPLYVYDVRSITRQAQKLSRAFEALNYRIFYAAKALTNIHILKHIHILGMGVDCVSIHEVDIVQRAGFKPSQILYTPNSVDFDEIEKGLHQGIHLNIDNLVMLEKLGKKYGNTYPVLIRINPHIMAGGNIKISTGHEHSKFGISIHQLDQILALVDRYQIHIKGLHLHTGSEIKDIPVYLQGLQTLLNLVPDFKQLEIIDLGGGFKVSYQQGDAGTDVEALGKALEKTMLDFAKTDPRPLQFWFEPGKYLVSEAGVLVTKVNVVKIAPRQTFVGINSGFNHLIRPMFYEAYHEILNVSHPQGVEKKYNVVGNICETDTFATDRLLNEVREGDLLVFKNAGAYGFEMSSNFNSRLRPAEVMIGEEGQAQLIRRRDTIEDLLRNQLEV